MAATSREARRRKIVERGSDRLAFISGRIDSLPPPAPVNSFNEETVTPSKPLIPGVEDLPPHLPYQTHDFREEDNVTNSLSTTETISSLPLKTSKISRESIGALDSETSKKEVPCFSDGAQDSSTVISNRDLEQHFTFTLKELSNAIGESESTRRNCAIAVAVLVVLSFSGFPLPWINLRPFYLVLFTNLTIVLARLVLGKERGSKMSVQGGNRGGPPSLGGRGLAEQAGKALEAGLVLQKATEAVLMDFSVYTVTIVSSLSILRKFGY